MAKAKRTAAPVKASAASDRASKVPEKAARGLIDRGDRQHSAVVVAVRRVQRLRIRPVKHSAALARD